MVCGPKLFIDILCAIQRCVRLHNFSKGVTGQFHVERCYLRFTCLLWCILTDTWHIIMYPHCVEVALENAKTLSSNKMSKWMSEPSCATWCCEHFWVFYILWHAWKFTQCAHALSTKPAAVERHTYSFVERSCVSVSVQWITTQLLCEIF